METACALIVQTELISTAAVLIYTTPSAPNDDDDDVRRTTYDHASALVVLLPPPRRLPRNRVHLTSTCSLAHTQRGGRTEPYAVLCLLRFTLCFPALLRTSSNMITARGRRSTFPQDEPSSERGRGSGADHRTTCPAIP